ncbi:membrane-bound lytic murein transglycosylase A [Kaistia soli DSM 19436]|uniref:peptidoglycan lytic exotransglycosylase n=1 Tax=Kaistia soli DSM 19436 TaxID=1122133 RepID=A0A1M5CWT5_9HYPH|nr:MltA domain-containing protein [Kaistia soli]SHF59250.1 membrane-bound lytic murein transglycosylase A [Kaistia soli DSM 19436]
MTSGEVGPLVPVGFDTLAGWNEDDHASAFRAFRLSAAYISDKPPKTRALGVDGEALSAVARQALALPEALDAGTARVFFETHFLPHEGAAGDGFFTGYYEPEADASRVADDRFQTPLLCPPVELVEVDETAPPPGLPPGMRFARKVATGFEPFFDRGAIMAGALDGRGLEIAYLADAVEAYFVHVQGAARLRMRDGTLLRVTYAAKSGHDYRSIGRELLDRGALQRGGVTMQSIRAWLADHPDEAAAVMASNPSYIFFREAPVEDASLGPIAAAKVPLSAGRSLAVDRTLHTFHAPIWIETSVPEPHGLSPFRRLLIAQDTGSAILGPGRGDIFFGSGDAAGETAGRMQAKGRFVTFLPRSPQ